MRKYLLTVLVTMFTLGAAMSQSAMSSGDALTVYNSGAALGSAANPSTAGLTPGKIIKWVYIPSGRVPWSASRYKPYYIQGSAGTTLPFRLRYPNSYDSVRTQKYPIIVFLHGAGEAKTDLHENNDQLFWGAEKFQDRMNQGEANAFLLFPQATAAWTTADIPQVKVIVDSIVATKNGDPDRVIVMGLSSGGGACIIYANAFPKDVASILPSPPTQVSNQTAVDNFIQVPVWMGNGGTDGNPEEESATGFYNLFHDKGGNIYQNYWPTQGHDIWNLMWDKKTNDNAYIMSDYWNTSHKAQPLVYYDRKSFCTGSPISAKMGISPGYFQYQWQKNTNGTYVDIPAPAGTANEYTATEAGYYRVRFRRVNGGVWSDWTPSPIAIVSKPCSVDTLFKEDFEYDKDYLTFGTATPYKKYTFGCKNGYLLSGTENHVTDATGIQGRRLSYNNTFGGCTYATNDNVWAMYNNQVGVTPGVRYMFSFSLGNFSSTTPLAQLTPRINGTDLIAGSVSGPNSGNNYTTWRRFNFIWTNPNNQSFADLAIKNKALSGTSGTGSDFVLDEISFTRLRAPGGVYGSALWVKAETVPGEDGQGIANWQNVSGGTDMLQTSFSAVPNLKNIPSFAINFVPVAQFAAARSITAQTGNYAGSTTHSRGHIFMVGKFDSHTQVDDVIQERENDNNRLRINLDAPSGADQMGKISYRTGSTTLNVQATNVTKAGEATLWSFSRDNIATASGNRMDIRKNGTVVASNNTSGTFDLNDGAFTLGGYLGSVAEVIYYLDSNITALRQSTIESYLALKYGMTLGTPASPANYLASDSATNFWPGLLNIAAYGAFQNDVFGVGTDDNSGLRSLRSNSVNTGSGDGTGQSKKGNIILSVNSALADKRFLMMGNDAATLNEQVITAGTAPALIENGGRVGREWKIKNTGSVGAVNISFDTTGFTYTGGNVLSNFKLMIDGDGNGNFANGTITFFNATSATGNRINFDGVTLADGVVFTVVVKTPAGSLPATWLGFTAEQSNGNGLLNWKTSEEINVSYYAVEHSTTGSNFKEIGRVSAKNTTSVNSYDYTDPSLAAGVHYYRIRRVDLDGKFNYSVVKTIKVSAVNAIQLRPNPVTGGNLVLAISLQRNEKATIQIVGVDGKVMSRRNTDLVQGANNVTIDVSNVPTGVYLVQVQLNDEVASKKFIKVR